MKKLILIALLILPSLLSAQDIRDVPDKDGASPAIKRSVKEGYLPLYQNKKFKPGQSINRRELAIAIDKLLDEINSKNLLLNKVQIQELTHLSSSYKPAFTTMRTEVDSLSERIQKLQSENSQLHHDLSRLEDEHKKQSLMMWIGIGCAALLGMVI